MMRSVSFVDRLELDYSGNHFSHAVCLGDVDGDGMNELVIGNVDGVLSIFRGVVDTKPWRKYSDLGMITSVAVGDVLNKGQNVVICSTAEGVCHIFDLQAAERSTVQSQTGTSMRPIHSQHLSLNIKTMLVANIDGSLCNDLFVSYMDRAVGVYRWDINTSSFIPITERLPLAAQVGSMSVGSAAAGGVRLLLVSQAGGTYIPLVYSKPTTEDSSQTVQKAPSVELTYEKGSMDGVVGVAQRRNPTVCTEVVGGIATSPPSSEKVEREGEGEGDDGPSDPGRLTAICTLDGSIKLMKNEIKQWELQVDHSLFSLHKLDITGSGCDEIVGCAWDGMTYIVDQQRNVVKYHVGENVCAFCAGYYGRDGSNISCLVYTTFHNQILVYCNVSLPAIPSTNLLQALQTNGFPMDVNKQWDAFSNMQKKSRIHSCLYASIPS